MNKYNYRINGNKNKLYAIVETDEENDEEVVNVVPTNNSTSRIRIALATAIVLLACFLAVFYIPHHLHRVASTSPATDGLAEGAVPPQDNVHISPPTTNTSLAPASDAHDKPLSGVGRTSFRGAKPSP